MEVPDIVSETLTDGSRVKQVRSRDLRPFQDWMQYPGYVLSLAMSISLWFIAIRAPLWLDETISFWQIHAGFSGIWHRQGLTFPAYSYILWLGSVILGTSEVALRIPEILAMLGAVYLLYRAAWELFRDRDVAFVTAIVFSLHPLVIFAAIDVRPYAFGAMALNASILALVRMRHSESLWLAAFFGALGAFIVYFHFLMIVVLPALAIAFVALKIGDPRALWRQGGMALVTFALAFLPVIPGLLMMFRTSGDHAWSGAPQLSDLVWTLAPGWLAYIFIATFLVAIVTRKFNLKSGLEAWGIVLIASSALIPILILYYVSTETSIHVFIYRYRLVAIPGIALCWGWIVSRVDSRALRLVFCMALVGSVVYQSWSFPASRQHGYTWKYALEAAENNASVDNATVLMCSDLPEADHTSMPVGAAVKDSTYFAPLTYYQLTVPVVGLPRALNDQATRMVSSFFQEPQRRHERFLALGFVPSYKTLTFVEQNALATHRVRVLGTFDGIRVLEFTPRETNAAD